MAGVTASLQFLMTRHAALRTRLVFDADGNARQSCSAEGELPVHIVDTGDEDPAEVAARITTDYQERNFDYENEWPVRMAVVHSFGIPKYAVTVYLHLVIDADGLGALLADLAAMDPTRPVGTPPLEQARQQRSASARRHCAASLRHLEHVFRTMTPNRFGEPRYQGAEGYFQVRYRSPATGLAIRTVAAVQGSNTSSVLLAVFAVGLARFTGVSPVMTWLMVNNRFRPGFAESVSALTQISPFLIDVTDATLADAVLRARGGAMSAYKNAYYDPDLQDEVIGRINAERGVDVDYSCFYNDRRQSERDPGGPVPTTDQILAAVGQSEFEPDDEPGLPRQKLYFHVAEAQDALDFIMSVDTRYFSLADTETILRGMEAVAVEMAVNPKAPTGVSAAVAVEAGVDVS